jgi:GH25 family lysozyme M1 (1,4-beta-N-acetylmuramidase)
MSQLEGVDVSHHNGSIDWQRVRNAGIRFAAIKATEGRSFVDGMAMTNLEECRAADIVPAMYHFYHHDVDPEAQAAHFIHNIGPHEPGDLPPAIDVEAPGDGAGTVTYPASEVVRRLTVCARAIQSAIGRAPLIYTYPSAWAELTNDSRSFANTNPLWIASYGVESPRLPGGWTDYLLWQYTDRGTVPGIDRIVDRDRFNGTLDDLDTAGAHVLEIGAMAEFNQDGNVRADPGLTGARVGVLTEGTGVVIVDGPIVANGRDWWKVDDGAGVVGWASSKVISAV